MNLLWICYRGSYGFPVDLIWAAQGFRMVCQRISYGLPMDSLSLSTDYLWICLVYYKIYKDSLRQSNDILRTLTRLSMNLL